MTTLAVRGTPATVSAGACGVIAASGDGASSAEASSAEASSEVTDSARACDAIRGNDEGETRPATTGRTAGCDMCELHVNWQRTHEWCAEARIATVAMRLNSAS